jgi:GNAT superfamily N-acetyltransferase
VEPLHSGGGPGGEAHLITIRYGAIEDVDALAKIADEGWRFAYRGIIPDEVLDTLDGRARAARMQATWNDRGTVIVAEENGTPLGFARDAPEPRLPGFDAEIEALYVDPAHSRGGVGRALVAAMVEELYLPKGSQTLCIHTLEGNRIGRSFYEKLGGELVGRDDWTWNGGTYKAVWYGYRDLSALL